MNPVKKLTRLTLRESVTARSASSEACGFLRVGMISYRISGSIRETESRYHEIRGATEGLFWVEQLRTAEQRGVTWNAKPDYPNHRRPAKMPSTKYGATAQGSLALSFPALNWISIDRTEESSACHCRWNSHVGDTFTDNADLPLSL